MKTFGGLMWRKVQASHTQCKRGTWTSKSMHPADTLSAAHTISSQRVQTRWAHRPEGQCSGGVRSSAVDDQTNGIGQLLYDIRDHIATQQTSKGSAV